jgi:S1-C subfamily serine protease
MIPLRPLALLVAFVFGIDTVAAQTSPAPIAPSLPSEKSLVRVNSTNQAYNFVRPWSKRRPTTRRGIGVVIEGGKVLVTAELIANHSYVELERPASSGKIAAEVERVDYESNLAILAPQDPKFLAGTEPVKLADAIQVGTKINVVQLESTGAVALTPGVITTITVSGYPADGISLLAYRLSAPLQYRDNSFTMPVFVGDRLAGLLMRYDTRSQSADIIPDAVISNFLARASRQPYEGFLRAGIAFAPTRDPQFRHYLGMTPEQTGVYVSAVSHGSAAEKAGLEKGDVIMRVGDGDVDEDGNTTHPAYGKIPFSYLVSTASLPGGKLPIRILRDGKTLTLDLPLEPRDPATVISEPEILDRAPRYYILGGLVFQELSRPYLREWGSSWRTDAPPRLVYLDEFQDELPPDRGKIVILSQVLPADTTLGYDNVETSVVEKINGRDIRSLEDVAEASKHPEGEFDKIELESNAGVLYLNAADVANSARQLKDSYGLPALDNLSDPATKVAP